MAWEGEGVLWQCQIARRGKHILTVLIVRINKQEDMTRKGGIVLLAVRMPRDSTRTAPFECKKSLRPTTNTPPVHMGCYINGRDSPRQTAHLNIFRQLLRPKHHTGDYMAQKTIDDRIKTRGYLRATRTLLSSSFFSPFSVMLNAHKHSFWSVPLTHLDDCQPSLRSA